MNSRLICAGWQWFAPCHREVVIPHDSRFQTCDSWMQPMGFLVMWMPLYWQSFCLKLSWSWNLKNEKNGKILWHWKGSVHELSPDLTVFRNNNVGFVYFDKCTAQKIRKYIIFTFRILFTIHNISRSRFHLSIWKK